VIAGTQGGKTSYGPLWLYNEIKKCGPGDYLIVTPTFPLLERKLLQEFLRLFERRLRLGRYRASPSRVFVFSPRAERSLFKGRYDANIQTRVQFGFAADPDSLESMTAKAAWLDEAGQKKFKREAWQAVLRRLSLAQGRILVTTSVYALHWLKELADRAAGGDSSIELIRFDSAANPGFPRDEFERAMRDLPRAKFNMLYRGLFDRPAGQVYDCVDHTAHKVPRFTIPPTWKRYLGLDFGTVNMAGIFVAEEPNTGRLYIHRTYHERGESAQGHVRKLLRGEPGLPYCVGGSTSEDEWRSEFRQAGLPVRKPKTKDVEIGITRTYGAWQRGELFAFEDLSEFWDELGSYSRELDEHGNPTERIEDPHTFHLMDAMRYIVADLKTNTTKTKSILIHTRDPLTDIDTAKKGNL
jgi:hypothetical protein